MLTYFLSDFYIWNTPFQVVSQDKFVLACGILETYPRSISIFTYKLLDLYKVSKKFLNRSLARKKAHSLFNFQFRIFKLWIFKFRIPNCQIPNVQIPNFQIPNVQIPNFQIANFQIPKFQISTFNFKFSFSILILIIQLEFEVEVWARSLRLMF